MNRQRTLLVPCLLAAALAACSTPPVRQAGPGAGSDTPVPHPQPSPPVDSSPTTMSGVVAPASAPSAATGLAIYESFREGLAEPGCGDTLPRWNKHFAHAPRRLGDADADTLPLFGYVVDALREAGLPTEFALIPFIESGYAPGARSKAGR